MSNGDNKQDGVSRKSTDNVKGPPTVIHIVITVWFKMII